VIGNRSRDNIKALCKIYCKRTSEQYVILLAFGLRKQQFDSKSAQKSLLQTSLFTEMFRDVMTTKQVM